MYEREVPRAYPKPRKALFKIIGMIIRIEFAIHRQARAYPPRTQ